MIGAGAAPYLTVAKRYTQMIVLPALTIIVVVVARIYWHLYFKRKCADRALQAHTLSINKYLLLYDAV